MYHDTPACFFYRSSLSIVICRYSARLERGMTWPRLPSFCLRRSLATPMPRKSSRSSFLSYLLPTLPDPIAMWLRSHLRDYLHCSWCSQESHHVTWHLLWGLEAMILLSSWYQDLSVIDLEKEWLESRPELLALKEVDFVTNFQIPVFTVIL